MSSLGEYSASVQAPGVATLGSLAWYSSSESVKVPFGEMVKNLTEVGLDAYQPRPPRDDDVFRRVCSAAQRKRVPTVNTNVFENYLIRDVKRGQSMVTRQIVREQVDGDNKRLNYTPLMELVFTQTAGTIADTEIGQFTPEDYKIAREIASDIKAEYLANRGTLNGYSVRELFRRVILSSAGTAVRPSGGVYFVSDDHIDKLHALEELSDRIAGTSFHTLPLVDTARQRTMLREAFESETVDAVREKLVEIDQLMALDPDKVDFKRIEALKSEIKPLKAKVKSYSDLLEDNLDRATVELKSLDGKIVKLIMRSMGGDDTEE